MKFDKKSDAMAYCLSQSLMTHYKHKVVYCSAWYFDRDTGEYYQKMCYTVILKQANAMKIKQEYGFNVRSAADHRHNGLMRKFIKRFWRKTRRYKNAY